MATRYNSCPTFPTLLLEGLQTREAGRRQFVRPGAQLISECSVVVECMELRGFWLSDAEVTIFL